ncbi:hypothetical protein ACFXDJ_35320 [Streptomyces sp. NPDC059443]|uniref:hypothetical protein n=1 Tax=unclassified Streptomyces TaxID=2593676 RepID=UPI0036B74633
MLETHEKSSAVLAGTLLRNTRDPDPAGQMRRVEAHLNQHHPQADHEAISSLAMTTLHLVNVGGKSAEVFRLLTGMPATTFLTGLEGPKPASTLVLRLLSRLVDRLERGAVLPTQEVQVIKEFIDGAELADATEAVSLMSDAAVFAAYAAVVSLDATAAYVPTEHRGLIDELTAELPEFPAPRPPRPQKKRSPKRKKRR